MRLVETIVFSISVLTRLFNIILTQTIIFTISVFFGFLNMNLVFTNLKIVATNSMLNFSVNMKLVITIVRTNSVWNYLSI
jgi:hypothetical protein